MASDIDLSAIGKDIATLVVMAGFARTKSEARRLIQQQAIKLGNTVIQDQFARVVLDDDNNFLIVERSVT